MTEEAGGPKQTRWKWITSAATILAVIVGSKFHIRAEKNESSDTFATALESEPDKIGLTFLLTLPLAAISADVT